MPVRPLARDAVVLVTGASAGIGRSVTEQLTARGLTVVGVGRDPEALRALQERTGATAVVADLAHPDSAAQVVDAALAAHGRLDAVVANAGVGHLGPVAEMSPERIAELVDVNLRAPMLLARAALPALRRQPRGALVFVGSIAGAVGVPGETVYSATKAGLAVFADLLREEVRAGGITVSTLVPGVVDTAFFQRRGAAYDRAVPRPLPVEQVARRVVDLLDTGAPRRVEPRWLAVPARIAATAPGLYRLLARRFG
ncbi:MAG TPA: SDR family NAD(P)-dependent oxidoreductase [Motilibacteraceae bacterium]|nr:SDR family NAD(P)-dependent oxidoreductase [Motilibacteraceae bacterium]